MSTSRTLRHLISVLAAIALVVAAVACDGDDADDDPGTDTTATEDTASGTDTVDPQEDTVAEDTTTPEDTTTAGTTLLGTEKLTFKVGDSTKEIALADIEKTTFEDNEAVRLSLFIDQGVLDAPYAHLYNFIASDGWDTLVNKLEGDLAGLLVYNEAAQGYFYQNSDPEDGLSVGYDEDVIVPKYLKAKVMDGGTVEAIPFPDTFVLVLCGAEELRAGVDISTLATTQVVDFHHPEDGEKTGVVLSDIITAAGIATPEAYGYHFTASDGFANNMADLVPWDNMSHGYSLVDSRDIIFEEEYETNTECCWRVKDTVVIRAFPLE